MSTNEQTPLSQPTSAVRNTLGKEHDPQNLARLISNEDMREYYDKNYHQILPIIAEKLHQEKAQQEKIKAVKARLNFEEASRYFESETPIRRRNLKDRLGHRYSQTRFGSQEPRRGRSKSLEEKDLERRTLFKRLEEGTQKAATKVLALKKIEIASEKHRHKREYSRRTKAVSESEGSAGGHWKSKLKKQNSSIKDDLSQAWVCEETYPFTPRIRYFDFPKARMPRHIKTYDGKKCIIDPVEIHNIKQRDRESTEEFVRRYKLECRDVKGAPECMKISRFMHGITNPELIKRLHDKIPKSMDEMMSVTTTFLRGEVAASNRERKKSFPSWKQKAGLKKNFKRGNFRNEQRTERKQDRFTLLTKTPKEILALDKGKSKPPSLMTISVEKRNASKFYGGSSSEILYEHCFSKFRQKIKNQLIPANAPLVGFSREIIWPLRHISLLVKVGDEEHSTSAWMNFMVVRSHSPYNGIIGRPWVRNIRAIPSTTHEMIKFLVASGIVTLQSSMIIPLESSMVLEPGVPRPVINQVTEEKIQVAIHPEYQKQTITIGSTLTEDGQKELCGLLRPHLDVHVRLKPADMTGVPRHIAEHRLNVREGCLPIRQKKRGVMVKKHDDS
nr:reverse transcriptase domain-containing protein [Tanacetum cinerariifolium]